MLMNKISLVIQIYSTWIEMLRENKECQYKTAKDNLMIILILEKRIFDGCGVFALDAV